MGYKWLGEGWPDDVGSRRSSRDFDVRRRLAAEHAARIVAGLRMCPVDRWRPVAPRGPSRARDVNSSKCQRGSAWFRSNDRSCSVPAVFELPLRSERAPRRADAVVIPPAPSSRQDLTVIARRRFKVRRQMRRQGGRGRPDGLGGSRTEKEETHLPRRLQEGLRPVGARAIRTHPAQLSHRGAQPTWRTQRPQRSQARSFAGRDAGRRESCGDR